MSWHWLIPIGLGIGVYFILTYRDEDWPPSVWESYRWCQWYCWLILGADVPVVVRRSVAAADVVHAQRGQLPVPPPDCCVALLLDQLAVERSETAPINLA